MKLVIELEVVPRDGEPVNQLDIAAVLRRASSYFAAGDHTLYKPGNSGPISAIYPDGQRPYGSWEIAVERQRKPGDSCRFIRLAADLTIVKHADDCEEFLPGVYTDPRQERSNAVITSGQLRALRYKYPDAAW